MSTGSTNLDTAEGAQEYQYEPLTTADAMRVLVVQPAHKLEDPLRCSIVHYMLSTELSSNEYCSYRHYSAVSYTWGTASPSHRLLIVPHLAPGATGDALAYLNITPNVDSLLRHLRKAHKEVPLWIDAVCLNQLNEEEKAQQIPRMGNIYRAAKKVHIWLGNHNVDDACRAFSVIRQVEFQNEWDLSEDEVSILTTFFRHSWFTRRWIIQEAVLAHEAILHCGPASLALSWVLMALKKARNIEGELSTLGYGSKMLLSSAGKYQEAPDGCSMLTLLWDLHLSECSDPRDRIAALYGLARNRPPDLRYNEGAIKLYWDCAAYFFDHNSISAHNLILHLAEFGSFSETPQGRVLPSWVPDWSRNRGRPSLRLIDELHDSLEPFRVTTTYGAFVNGTRVTRAQRTYYANLFPGLEAYCNKFKHPTQISVHGHILRVRAHPLIFPKHGGVVSEVYRCESSDWKDVWSLLSRVLKQTNDPLQLRYSNLEKVLSAAHMNMWGKEMYTDVPDFEDCCSRMRKSLNPLQEDIQYLKEVGSILSRFSILQTTPQNTSFHFPEVGNRFYMGPRDAAVGDIMIPFTTPASESSTGVCPWLVLLCLRPTLGEGMEIYMGKLGSEQLICQTVRWVGLIFDFQLQRQDWWLYSKGWLDEDIATTHFQMVREAWGRAEENHLPDPYFFDVV